MKISRIQLSALSQWPHWRLGPSEEKLTHAPILSCQLKGGLTNTSYLLLTPERKLKLRINSLNTRLLGIDRSLEAKIVTELAPSGICPQLLYSDPHQRYSIFEYVEGRVWGAVDFNSKQQCQRLLGLVDVFQGVKFEHTSFSYANHLNTYQGATCVGENLTHEESEQLNNFIVRFRAFESSSWVPVLSHHDLVAENIVEHEGGLSILDWEYAALGHPDFDRKCIAAKSALEKLCPNSNDIIYELMHWMNRLWEAVNK
ncbi:MAG: thiamine kinase [Lentisphaeria bacterium]|jgi:thiamine kinase